MLSYKKVINRYVIKVDPAKAVLEPDYFIRMIETAEKNRDDEICNIEAGIENKWDADKEIHVESEWEKL